MDISIVFGYLQPTFLPIIGTATISFIISLTALAAMHPYQLLEDLLFHFVCMYNPNKVKNNNYDIEYN